VLPDHSAIYFVAWISGTTDYNDIYRARWNGIGFDSPTLVAIEGISPPATGLSFREANPVVTPDESTLYFALFTFSPNFSEIRMARRTGAGFGAPELISSSAMDQINTIDDEWPSWVSPDNCELYFTRRPDGVPSDIYVARRTPPPL
jgi:hypothetical protein